MLSCKKYQDCEVSLLYSLHLYHTRSLATSLGGSTALLNTRDLVDLSPSGDQHPTQG